MSLFASQVYHRRIQIWHSDEKIVVRQKNPPSANAGSGSGLPPCLEPNSAGRNGIVCELPGDLL